MGYRWPAAIPHYVGEILPRCRRDSVRLSSFDLVAWLTSCRFVVDAADPEKFEAAKKELQELLSKPPLAGIPLLVLGVRPRPSFRIQQAHPGQNKNDLRESVGVEQLIEKLYLPFSSA